MTGADGAHLVQLRSRRGRSIIPRIVDVPWQTLVLHDDDHVPGAVFKLLSHGFGGLSEDPDMPVQTWLVHIPPMWFDPVLTYHPSTEEYFRLVGTSPLGFKSELGGGSYTYRPPGILHGSRGFTTGFATESGTAIYRFCDPTVQDVLLRYEGTAVPQQNYWPVTDEAARWPIDWIEFLDPAALEWAPVEQGPWRGTLAKRLSCNRVTGGGAVLLRLPPGWRGEGSRARGTVEEFVLEGPVSMGCQWFETWGYACRPQGDPAGVYVSPNGSTLLCFWDDDELAG